jgi:hypothetical protein
MNAMDMALIAVAVVALAMAAKNYVEQVMRVALGVAAAAAVVVAILASNGGSIAGLGPVASDAKRQVASRPAQVSGPDNAAFRAFLAARDK